jgi:GNAT superfamily N-acetyltransferase
MLRIRAAVVDDVPLILSFIRKLAEYEKLSNEVVATEAGIRESMFGARPVAEAVIASWGGEPAGFALYFHNFSTFQGRPGIYLEDLFVEPAYRRKGIGKALFGHLAQIANERSCGRLEWSVLDWNQPSIEFYVSLGAIAKAEWTTYRLSGDSLKKLAES